jgi:hypothetical protein
MTRRRRGTITPAEGGGSYTIVAGRRVRSEGTVEPALVIPREADGTPIDTTTPAVQADQTEEG